MFRSNFLLISLAFFVWFTLTSAKVRYFSQDNFGEEGPVGFSSDTSTVNRKTKFNAAILVAGTAGYWNYRHQADMCHAYQMLKKKGMPSDNIIVFVYDDIARNSRNPFQGKIYNVPGGYDVYPGCAKDYTGGNVTKKVLTAVLNGDAEAVKGKGSGRVLKQNRKQRVFFAYSGRGSDGYIIFPSGSYLYANEFNKLLVDLQKNKKMFRQIMVYIESSYAGSMFNGMPIADKKMMLGVGAAGPNEGSYATYCPSSSTNYTQIVNPNKIGACMGDLFSVSWIMDAEAHDVWKTLVSEHLERVTNATRASGTQRGSHVSVYGDKKKLIHKKKLANFFSGQSAPKTNPFDSIGGGLNVDVKWVNQKQTDADLEYLYFEASKNSNFETSLELKKELAMRRHTDEVIYNSLNSLVISGVLPADTPVSKFAEVVISRGQNEPVVSDWDCLRGMVDAWEDKCGQLNSYSGQYSRTFANLCNALVTPAAFKESIKCQESVFAEWAT